MKTTKSKTDARNTASAKRATDSKATDKLPGEYEPGEDIMNQSDKVERVHVDLDNMTLSRATSQEAIDDSSKRPLSHTVKKTTSKTADKESDLTKEDLEALGPRDLSMDGGDDEELKHRRFPVDFAASDLDIPGSELDDDAEERGSEDEENNSYSLGGDNHDDSDDANRG